jgi:RNA polymerase subunit RPABC4/transcription elongation factor Spt4
MYFGGIKLKTCPKCKTLNEDNEILCRVCGELLND